MNIKKALIITAIFVLLDFAFHYFGLLPDISSLPERYFINKIVTALIIIFIADWLLPKVQPWIIAIALSGYLQLYSYTKYFDTKTSIIMFILHATFIYVGYELYPKVQEATT